MRTDDAYRRLRDLIVGGAYAPGQRITELEASALLDVSRTPVREAFRALAGDGLVAASGRGVAVVALDGEALAHAYRVRAALEAMTAELAAERQAAGRIAPAELDELEAEARAAEELAAAGDLARSVLRNRRFHQRIAELAANPIACQMLDRLWDLIVVSTRASLEAASRRPRVAGEHRTLLDAIRAGRPADAAAAARAHALGTEAALRTTRGNIG